MLFVTKKLHTFRPFILLAIAAVSGFVQPLRAETLIADGAEQKNRIISFDITRTLMGTVQAEHIQIIAGHAEDATATFALTGEGHSLENVETSPLAESDYAQYTVVVVRLAANFTFEQCVEQMHKVLKLASRYDAHPLAFYRIQSATGELHDADLAGIIGWDRQINALRFAVKFEAQRKRLRLLAAHQLSDATAYVAQAKKSTEHH